MWMLAAVTALTIMFAIVKHLVQDLPVFVIGIMRTFIALLMLAPWLMRVGTPGIMTQRLGSHFLRAFFGIAAFVCIIYALGELLMADAVVLAFTTPFWSIVVSAIVLGEIAGPRRILATLVGFVGVVLIVKPQLGIQPATLVALLSAFFTSLAMITMKRLSATEPPTRIVFYFFLFGTLVLLVPAIITWKPPTLVQWAWLLGAGVLGAIGQDWLARAYDAAEVTIVAPFDFMRLPVAAVLGFFVFDEVPDMWTGIGTLIIIGASLYIARREARTRRPKAAK